MKNRRRITIVRRQVKQLVAIAAERAVQAERPRARTTFRPLSKTEAEAIGRAELLATLAAARRCD